MPRRSSRSSGRNVRSIARRRSAPDPFDDAWFSDIAERFDARYIDLTREEDRRRWHPSRLGPYTAQPAPRGLLRRPRIIIVPEGHRLARRQTYGGRFSLSEVLSNKYLQRYRAWEETYADDPIEHHAQGWTRRGRFGKQVHELSKRVGFALPWQVIVCVRRKRRREVLHALNVAGGKGIAKGRRIRRTEYSEVRC